MLTKVSKHRRNPIILAQEWQGALSEGKYGSRADLARHKGISRARVTQILRLLKLCPEVLDMLVALGEPLPWATFTERSLRSIVELPPDEQKLWIATTMGKQISQLG